VRAQSGGEGQGATFHGELPALNERGTARPRDRIVWKDPWAPRLTPLQDSGC